MTLDMRHLRVAVIDDEVEVLELVRDVLEDDGIAVIAISRPDRISDVYRGGQLDCVLMDLMLPGMTGIDLTRRLRAGGLGRIPIIAMSASSAMLREAELSGLFHDTLSKPFDITELLQTVYSHAAVTRTSSAS